MTDPIDVRHFMTDRGVGRYALTPATVIGIAVHHSVSGSFFFVPPAETQDDEVVHLKAIDSWHAQLGWNGFGYHMAAFPSGRFYLCGSLAGARAHVASRNNELVGVVLIGDFTLSTPPAEQLYATAYAINYIRQTYPSRRPRGHREWALPEYPTACPGNSFQSWLPGLDTVPQEDDMNEAEATALFTRLHAAAHAGGGQRTHTIVSGDTLWDLAGTYYGDGTQWPRIRDANPGINPDALQIGAVIVIP